MLPGSNTAYILGSPWAAFWHRYYPQAGLYVLLMTIQTPQEKATVYPQSRCEQLWGHAKSLRLGLGIEPRLAGLHPTKTHKEGNPRRREEIGGEGVISLRALLIALSCTLISCLWNARFACMSVPRLVNVNGNWVCLSRLHLFLSGKDCDQSLQSGLSFNHSMGLPAEKLMTYFLLDI